MPGRIEMSDFQRDSHGREFRDVFEDTVNGPALEAALEVMNRPECLKLMVDVTERFDLPALAGCVLEIVELPEFLAAAVNPASKKFRRLKLAIGVACKLVMAERGFVPAFLDSEHTDMGRMEKFSKNHFKSARKYKKA